MAKANTASLPILDLSKANNPTTKLHLLEELRNALHKIGFLYITGHGVLQETITALTSRLPTLFELPAEAKALLSKRNSPHFLGYSGFAEEITLGKQDSREQFDFATELPVVYDPSATSTGAGRDFTKLYWRLRGPNQWPSEDCVPGFRQAFTKSASLSPTSHRRCVTD